MRLTRWNRNLVGTQFGGSLYFMCDRFFVIMLMMRLGPAPRRAAARQERRDELLRAALRQPSRKVTSVAPFHEVEPAGLLAQRRDGAVRAGCARDRDASRPAELGRCGDGHAVRHDRHAGARRRSGDGAQPFGDPSRHRRERLAGGEGATAIAGEPCGEDRLALGAALLGGGVGECAHVHLAESQNGVYLNPLRPGALTPYADTTVPVVSTVELRRRGSTVAIDPSAVWGAVDVVAVAYDPPPILPPAPWQTAVFVPALIRWRLIGPDETAILPWQTAVDLRLRCPGPSLFSTVFAPDTRQNRPGIGGHYAFWLDRGLDTSALVPGDYRIDVEASDIRGNTGTGTFAFSVVAPENRRTQSRKTT